MPYKLLTEHPLKRQTLGVIECRLPRARDTAPIRFERLAAPVEARVIWVGRITRGRWPSRFEGQLIVGLLGPNDTPYVIMQHDDMPDA